MGDVEKKGMITLITRCENVVNGEIALLDRWAADPQLAPNRRASCVKASQTIQATSKPRAQKIAADAAACPPHDVRRVSGESRVVPNEVDLAHRSTANVVQMPQQAFDELVDDCVHNSGDSANDARIILEDCTAP